jgi:hypothetical protein
MSTNTQCPCGSLYIPTGSKYNSNGLSLRLYYNDTYLDLKLVHNQDSYLSSGETFVSTTENITLNEPIIIKNIVLYHGNTYNLQINDIIKIVCKSFNSKNILGLINIGSLDNITNFDSSVIDNKRAIDIDGSCLNNTPINLYNDKIQLEIYSICDFFTPVCCDNIPNLMSLTNQINNLSIPCCSTTTTTTSTTPPPSGACCERGFTWNRETQSYIPYTNCLGILTEQQCNPYTSNDSQRVWLSGQFCDSCEDLDFCSQFLLPSSFNVNVIGYGDFDGQEAYVTFTKNGNTYSSSGVWPCGAYFELSMSCDEINKEFYYDGLISCCNQSTKWIHDPTPTPLIFPNARPPLIISYIDCNNCLDCVTTTTSTTPPPLPCRDTTFGPLTINGYAFYRRSNRTVNIPGIGPTQIKCAGGHVCNRTNFVPRLILNSVTLDAQPITVNNANDGGDRDDTFTFNIPDITLLKDGASIQLACTTNNCHQGVTAIVLTAEIDGVTRILFNSCLVPGNIVPINLGCPPIGASLGYTDSEMGIAPDGYSWNFISTAEELYSCKVLICGNPPNTCGGRSLNEELSNNLAQWINNGGIFLYQEEWSVYQGELQFGCGNVALANLAMSIAGSSMISEGGPWSGSVFVDGYTGVSSNSPCVNGITFYGAFTAKISGGTPLVYAPDGDYPGAYTMMGQKIGQGHVILLGDINIIDYAPQSSASWTEFLRRLLTLDQIL